jgi:urea-proton symporter
MAIMSTYSSELIAVSSIVTYDIYRTYINKDATGKQLMRINYIGMICFALFMAAFATGLYYVGISMGYLYVMMGVIISSAVLPATLTLMWSDQSWAAATFSPILGLACSLAAWFVTTKVRFGELTVSTTGANEPMLAGNVVALLSPLIFIPLLTYIPPFKPQKYDWQSMLQIHKVDDYDIADEAHVDLERVPGEAVHDEADEQAKLAKAAKTARWLTVFMTLALLVLWPMPMFGSGYIFSREVRYSSPLISLPWIAAIVLTLSSVLHWLGCCRPHLALCKFRHGYRPTSGRVAGHHYAYRPHDGPRFLWKGI